MSNPAQLRQLMDSPMVQSITSNPDLLRSLLLSNPQMRDLMEVKFFFIDRVMETKRRLDRLAKSGNFSSVEQSRSSSSNDGIRAQSNCIAGINEKPRSSSEQSRSKFPSIGRES